MWSPGLVPLPPMPRAAHRVALAAQVPDNRGETGMGRDGTPLFRVTRERLPVDPPHRVRLTHPAATYASVATPGLPDPGQPEVLPAEMGALPRSPPAPAPSPSWLPPARWEEEFPSINGEAAAPEGEMPLEFPAGAQGSDIAVTTELHVPNIPLSH